MPIKSKLIEIQVHGFTSDGKTNVCEVIRKALISAYGIHTQVASYDLSLESGPNDNAPNPRDVIFVIKEINHGSMCTRKED